MITPLLIDHFVQGVRGQAIQEGTRYAREARVCGFNGTFESVDTVVCGMSEDYQVALWSEGGALHHRCSCPSWRDPCKHEVAAALVLRQILARSPGGEDGEATTSARILRAADDTEGELPVLLAEPDPDEARRSARAERQLAARREKLVIKAAEAPYLTVESSSGFAYRVHLRGAADGPHACDCPDFEANRLHTCKHVERVRTFMGAPDYEKLDRHRQLALRAAGLSLLRRGDRAAALRHPQGSWSARRASGFRRRRRTPRSPGPRLRGAEDLARQLGPLGGKRRAHLARSADPPPPFVAASA